MLTTLYNHRLKVFVIALAISCILFAQYLPRLFFDASLSLNQGVGYSAIVSALDEAGRYVEEQTEPGSVDRAQGYRYALRRVEQFGSMFFGDHDGASPTIDRCPSKLCKYGFDNPDATYVLISPLSSDYSYLIKGNSGTVAYMTVQLFHIGPDGFNTGGTLESAELDMDENGDFEILLARENSNDHPNFIALERKGGAQLLFRQLIRSWLTEREASFEVEVIGSEAPVPAPVFNQVMMDRRGVGFANLISANMRGFRDVIAAAPRNHLPKGAVGAGGGDGGFPTNFTSIMRYQLEPGHVVLIEVPQVDVVFSNIQMGSLWGESLSYGNRLVSYNDSQAFLDSDEVYRYVIAESDPGVPNWLDASGHPEGGVFHRWQSSQGTLPEPRVTVVPGNELRNHLPADHPVVTPSQRAATLKERLKGYNRRKNPVYR